MYKKHLQIAVDGPVGSGKTSLCDEVAKRLNILHLDTGAMYRAVGLAAIRNGISPDDEEQLSRLCLEGLALVDAIYKDNRQITLLNNVDVSDDIRTEEAGLAASSVSRFAVVRKYLVKLQQNIADKQSLIMDGRDIGTVVLPHAPLKIFLTANPRVRAQRRHKQLIEKGANPDFELVLQDLQKRDLQDSTRKIDPLKKADDAIALDTSDLSFEQSVQAIINEVKRVYGE
ncbi:MAG: (d)CMP kinase [Eubacteriales bacterium]|nr:(d)CMP kinase [Eubacteriales bacterium]